MFSVSRMTCGTAWRKRFQKPLRQLVQFGALLDQFFRQGFFAVGQSELVAGGQFRLPRVLRGGAAAPPARRASRKGRDSAMVSDQEFIAIRVAEIVQVHFAGVFEMADGLDDTALGGLDFPLARAGRAWRFPHRRWPPRVWRRRRGGCS